MLVLIFMIPLVFVKKRFWLNQYIYFLLRALFCYAFSSNYQVTYISYFIGIDLLSYIIIILRFWVCSLMIIASAKLYTSRYYYNMFMLILLTLLISLFATFSSLNLFVFYLFFEVSIIPTLILIVGWGYQPERLQAGVYLLFYTLLASLPIMVSIFYFYEKFRSLDFFLLGGASGNVLAYICMNIVFLIKIPMYFVHLWLPKAHVEAPVAGSIILAGVILKLGGYGLIRLIVLFVGISLSLNYVFIVIRIVGGLLVSLMCLRQVDIKSLIAYSSVAHIGLTLGGIITLSYWGICGSLAIIVAHGLCSSGLFCLANITYERLGSRRLYLNKGLINLIPSICLWWFMFTCCNMAAPPSINLLGEIILINSLVGWRSFRIVFLSLISFFRAAYSLYLYSYSQHGKVYSGTYSISSGYVREYLLLFLHWFPLNLLVLKREYFTLWV